jgi:hypothetical protein
LTSTLAGGEWSASRPGKETIRIVKFELAFLRNKYKRNVPTRKKEMFKFTLTLHEDKRFIEVVTAKGA